MNILVDKFRLHPVVTTTDTTYETTANLPYPIISATRTEENYVAAHGLNFATYFHSLLFGCPSSITEPGSWKDTEGHNQIIRTFSDHVLAELYKFRKKHGVPQLDSRPGYYCFAWAQVQVDKKLQKVGMAIRGELSYKPLEMGQRVVKDTYSEKIEFPFSY